MAIARLSMKVGRAGRASPHAAYIARIGQYASRLERGEHLAVVETGNMPAWAQADPLAFWQAADVSERANGTTYREMEIALPRELTTAQQTELVREWVRQEIGTRHAYQWAIHVSKAADGGEQPHVHLMFSERQCDGIERDPEQYFKRYNGKSPERGGARKGYGPRAGQTLTRAERAADLKAQRERWEDACNLALARSGSAARIDMRSHTDQGRDDPPERKQLPSEWRDPAQRANVIEFRAARAEQLTAERDVRQAVPDVRAEIVSLEAARHKRAVRQSIIDRARSDDPLREKQASLVRSEFEGRSGDALAEALGKSAADCRRFHADYDRQMRAADSGSGLPLRQACVDVLHAKAEFDYANEKLEDWHARHRIRSLLGIGGAGHRQLYRKAVAFEADMQKKRAIEAKLRAERDAAMERAMAGLEKTEGRHAALLALQAERAAIRQALERSPDQPEARQARQREEEQRRQEAERSARLAAQARDQVAVKFEKMAGRRRARDHGYTDNSRDWWDTPSALREAIDKYNSKPDRARAALSKSLRDDPEMSKIMDQFMQQRERNISRDRDQGRER